MSAVGVVPTGVYRDVVRWSDIDAAGIVCYGRYLRFFEGAEEELFRSIGLPSEVLAAGHGVWLVRRSITAEFTHPVGLGEELETTAVVTAVGSTSVHLSFTVCSAGRNVAAGEYHLVCVERESLRPTPVPPDVRHRLRGEPPEDA